MHISFGFPFWRRDKKRLIGDEKAALLDIWPNPSLAYLCALHHHRHRVSDHYAWQARAMRGGGGNRSTGGGRRVVESARSTPVMAARQRTTTRLLTHVATALTSDDNFVATRRRIHGAV